MTRFLGLRKHITDFLPDLLSVSWFLRFVLIFDIAFLSLEIRSGAFDIVVVFCHMILDNYAFLSGRTEER
jgi:hypothetical protein